MNPQITRRVPSPLWGFLRNGHQCEAPWSKPIPVTHERPRLLVLHDWFALGIELLEVLEFHEANCAIVGEVEDSANVLGHAGFRGGALAARWAPRARRLQGQDQIRPPEQNEN